MQEASSRPHPGTAEQGFMLLGLIVAIFLILLTLGVAAPRVAKSLRRDREVEDVQRGKQYVRAIQLFYRSTGHYPGSLEQLEKTNNIRFLRQRYVDTMTGKADWRLIHIGEAKTTVKGFFGQPLAGLPGAAGGLGSAAGMASSGQAGAGAAGTSTPSSTFGSSNSSFGNSGTGQTGGNTTFGGSGSNSTFGGSSSGSTFGGGSSGSTFGSGSGPTSTGTQSSAGSSFGSLTGGTGAPGSNNSSGISSQSATSFTGTGAPIVGVGSSAPGSSIIVVNEQTTYPTWEFLYDPRIEQLKAKAATLGGPASSSTSGFGGSATSPGINGSTVPGSSTTPTSPTTGITPPAPPQ